MKKILVFSFGLHPGQVTIETLAAMRKCGEVYSHCLDEVSARFFRGYVPGLKLTSGLDRRGTAEAAVRGLESHDTVGFLTYGNPLFLNQTAAELLTAAARKRAAVEVFPAVSSFDALVNLFGLNKYSDGNLRVADTASLINKAEFTPATDTLFFVPDVLNLPENAVWRKAFVESARRAYPASAPAYIADCASIASRKTRVVKGTIGGLARLLGKVNERHTLFIPAVSKAGKNMVARAPWARGRDR